MPHEELSPLCGFGNKFGQTNYISGVGGDPRLVILQHIDNGVMFSCQLIDAAR